MYPQEHLWRIVMELCWMSLVLRYIYINVWIYIYVSASMFAAYTDGIVLNESRITVYIYRCIDIYICIRKYVCGVYWWNRVEWVSYYVHTQIVLKCFIVCCSALQCVAVRWSVSCVPCQQYHIMTFSTEKATFLVLWGGCDW